MSTPAEEAGEGTEGEGKESMRAMIREEIAKALGHEGDEGEGAEGEGGGEEEGEESLTLRQITHRALMLTTAALAKIPGGDTHTATEPTPEKEKQPVSRGMKFLGFQDIDK